MSKILTVCFPFVGDDIGGSHISALKLVAGLDREKIRPLIVLHDTTGPVEEYLVKEGFSFITMPDVGLLLPKGHAKGASKWQYFVHTLPKLRALLRENNVDIVHTNDGSIHANWSIAAKAAGIKHIWHHRADPHARGINLLAPLLADRIITVSHFAKPNKPVRSVDHKTTVIHSPFEHPADRPDREVSRMALVDELKCSADTRFLGYFGGLIERKQPVEFVDIIHAFSQKHPEIPVNGLLFGVPSPHGPPLDEAVAARAADLGIADKIHLMGFRQPIEPMMCATDILLVPALYEPFGRTLIEAMLLGTPVVATDHGGNPEAIVDGENGFLVPPQNAEAFVAPIHKLLTDQECWENISRTARQQALTRFSTDRHVSEVMSIYNSLRNRTVENPVSAPVA